MDSNPENGLAAADKSGKISKQFLRSSSAALSSMAFPDTQLTLIQRLATSGREEDWRQFFQDYWGAVCRFARRTGAASWSDAEDVASETMRVLSEGTLLARWTDCRTAKLRTLLCAVVRNLLSNRSRVEKGREAILERHRDDLVRQDESTRAADDVFYAAWAESLVHSAVEALMKDYHATGRGDYFRALYSRICEDLSVAEVAEALDLPVHTIENYLRHGRQRLLEQLEERIRVQVRRYSDPAEEVDEFKAEWNGLGAYLTERGGLELAVRQAYEALIDRGSAPASPPFSGS